ncbi:Fanconi anemia core complex-associated protein 100-like [Acanthaster planci]|uniref:Fanconi anemia core complex-associated protein 100-like n=1 Tax=Acanthaster planci TaxID=133434 RepID=A0A8B7XPJ1_ACAPL|nr:Fanconi anemia core complex-associated protein 100-like [Acanthaster planci]
MAASLFSECEEKPKSKIAVTVDDICPGLDGSICISGEGKRHQICAIQNGTKFVYIYENATRKGILQLPDQCHCTCMCLSKDTAGDEHLMCGMQNGQIIHYNLQAFKDDTKSKKKRKKKDKHRSKNKPETVTLHHQESQEDIFGNLLEPTDAKPSSSHGPPPIIAEEDGLSENVVILGDSHILLNEPSVQDLILVKGCLVTCAKCAAGWTKSVYCQKVRGQPEMGNTTSEHTVGKRELEFERSASFRTFLPENKTRSSSHHGDRSVDQSGASPCLREPIGSEAEHWSKKPQLFCVVSLSMCKNEDVTKDTCRGRTLVLEDSLYNQLFGSDFNFLDTPIILISLPDGHIYYSPLKTHGITQVGNSKQGRIGSDWSSLNTGLFFALDEPAATIHGYNTKFLLEADRENLNAKTTQHGCDCVCIVGQHGRVIQITENITSNQRETLKFTENHVKGPVQTVCRTRTPQTLLYSTGKEMYSLSFSEASKKDASTAARRSNVSSSYVLGIGKIRAMVVLGRASKDSSCSNPVMALTEGGRVLKLHPSTDRSRDNRGSPITASAAGKRMQELLQAINNISERSGDLAKLSQAQDRVLREMSQACHVASLLLSNHNCAQNSTIFGMEIHCTFKNDGPLCSLELLCQLTNHNKWSLSHGWSLAVFLNAESDWTNLELDLRHHVTKIVPLVNFQPNQTIDFIYPLENRKTSLLLPLDVQCFLYFSPEECLSSILPEQTNLETETPIKMDEGGILLPLTGPTVIDLITVLRPQFSQQNAAQHTRQYQTAWNRGFDWLASALETAASNRPSANGTGYTNSEKTGDSTSASTCVTINADVTAMILQHKKNECSQEEQILRWLLEDNRLVAPSTNPLFLLTPDARVVTFQVKVQPARREGTGAMKDACKESGRREEAVEIMITAPDYPVLTHLQLAMNRRIKTLVQRAGRAGGITTSQDTLQKELRKVEALHRKVVSLQDNMILHSCCDNQCNHSPDSTAILELHQRMRSQLTFL